MFGGLGDDGVVHQTVDVRVDPGVAAVQHHDLLGENPQAVPAAVVANLGLTPLSKTGTLCPERRPFRFLMHLIVTKTQLSPNVTRLDVEARRIAEIRHPGQFVIVRRGDGAERIPLTIADADPAAGTIALVIQAVGKSTRELVALEPGDFIKDISGPLGHPTEMISSGRALCVGGGVGTAVVHPMAQGLYRLGVEVISVIGGRSKEWVIFEEELAHLGQVIVCTDDGSYGRKGFVTDAARDILDAGGVDVVYAVGPVPMMRAIANLTRPYGVHTIVSLNPVMVDGTGMCGGCRVDVGGQTRFACVEGPEFDGHQVDFDLLADRLGTYREFEEQATHACDAGSCRIGLEHGHQPTLPQP
jgi:ferredoxin--NADP+ reductase